MGFPRQEYRRGLPFPSASFPPTQPVSDAFSCSRLSPARGLLHVLHHTKHSMCIYEKLYRHERRVLPASCHVSAPSSTAVSAGRVETGRGGTPAMDVQESSTLWILPGRQKHVSSVGSCRAPGMRCSQGRRKLGKEGGRLPRKLSEPLPQRLREKPL